MYLHAIQFDDSGSVIVYHDPSGQATFSVLLTSSHSPIVTVHAKKD